MSRISLRASRSVVWMLSACPWGLAPSAAMSTSLRAFLSGMPAWLKASQSVSAHSQASANRSLRLA